VNFAGRFEKPKLARNKFVCYKIIRENVNSLGLTCVRPPVDSIKKHRGGDVLGQMLLKNEPKIHESPLAANS
jgi:hypothetical protein